MSNTGHNKTVFIGIPVQNGAAYLAQALDSIRQQTYPYWVAVVSDNSSIDESYEIAQRFSREDSRLRVVRQGNELSPKENFAYLLGKADTEYFCWLASDDFWSPEFLKNLVGALNENPRAGLAFGPYAQCDKDGRIASIGYRLRYDSRIGLLRLAKFLIPDGQHRDAIFYGLYRRRSIESAEVWKQEGNEGRPMAYAGLTRVLLGSEYLFVDSDQFLWLNRVHNQSLARARPLEAGWLEVRVQASLREAQALTRRTRLPLVSAILRIFGWLEIRRDFLRSVRVDLHTGNVRALAYHLRNHPQRPRFLGGMI